MGPMLIAPTEQTAWRVDVEGLHLWLTRRWGDIERRAGSTDQRADEWHWRDGYDLWVPRDRESTWIAADWPRISAVAAWLSNGCNEHLVLCDESYSNVTHLEGMTEQKLLALSN